MKQTNLSLLLLAVAGFFLTGTMRGASTGNEAEEARERKAKGVLLVMGGVNKPGPQVLAKGEKLSLEEAIKRAGGFTRFALKKIKVTRFDEKGEAKAEIIYLKYPKENDAALRVEAGDLVYSIEEVF